MTKPVLAPVADGTQEMEAVILINVLRRAGAKLTAASVSQLQITGSRGVKLVADCLIDECLDRTFDLVVLPGGMPGAENLRDDETLKKILLRQNNRGGLYGAICAAPKVVLKTHGLLDGKQATGHPVFSDGLCDPNTAASRVMVDGNL